VSIPRSSCLDRLWTVREVLSATRHTVG